MTPLSHVLLSTVSRLRNPSPDTHRVTLVVKAIFAQIAYLAILPIVPLEAILYRLCVIGISIAGGGRLMSTFRSLEHATWNCLGWNIYCIACNCFRWRLPDSFEEVRISSTPRSPDSKLGPNATRYIELEPILQSLPFPTGAQFQEFKIVYLQLINRSEMDRIDALFASGCLGTERARRAIQILYALQPTFFRLLDQPGKLAPVRRDLKEIFDACPNRESSVIEELFYKYYGNLIPPEKLSGRLIEMSLILDLQMHRARLLQRIINEQARARHYDQASNVTHLSARLAEPCFIPPPPLSSVDQNCRGCMREELIGPVLRDFKTAYTKQTIVEFVKNIVIHGVRAKLTRARFNDWAQKFADSPVHFNPNTGVFSDVCIEEFLIEHGFVTR